MNACSHALSRDRPVMRSACPEVRDLVRVEVDECNRQPPQIHDLAIRFAKLRLRYPRVTCRAQILECCPQLVELERPLVHALLAVLTFRTRVEKKPWRAVS